MFNFSKFEVTPFSYKQTDWYGSKISWPNGNTLQQTEECVQESCPSTTFTLHLADKGKGFITDGEESLYSALGKVVRHAKGLRFLHFQQNCHDKLIKIRICIVNEQEPFLDRVFGMSRSEGLLDTEDKSDLRAGMVES